VLQKAVKNSADATQDEWVDFVQVKSWQRTSGSCEIIKVGTLRSYDTEKRKSGEGNRSRMCTRLQKSWSTTPTLDRWHRWMDWDEDQWSGYSSGRSWSQERDTTRHQPFLWRKALNDDDESHPKYPEIFYSCWDVKIPKTVSSVAYTRTCSNVPRF